MYAGKRWWNMKQTVSIHSVLMLFLQSMSKSINVLKMYSIIFIKKITAITETVISFVLLQFTPVYKPKI